MGIQLNYLYLCESAVRFKIESTPDIDRSVVELIGWKSEKSIKQ